MTPEERKALLLDLAATQGLRLGATLSLAEGRDDRILAWLARGHAGEMAWLSRNTVARTDPAAFFAPLASLAVFLLDYGPGPPPSPDPRIGNISRYALGDDYHDVLKERLFAVLDGLRAAEPDVRGRVFVDTGPLLEKVLAERAGLGFQGRHTNLIREGHGSWFFLGEILLDRPLPPGRPAPTRCGTCDRCLPACPTGAIVAPFVLDARRCISYLTIELRGPMPADLRPLIGHRIFGCDDCQEVCPWNRFAIREPIAGFRPREGFRSTTLVAWLGLDRDDFARIFRKSPVLRARHAGFLRNVAVAIGNSGDRSAAPAVMERFPAVEPLVRRHLAWALGRLGGRGVRDFLAHVAATDPDSDVRAEAEAAKEAIESA